MAFLERLLKGIDGFSLRLVWLSGTLLILAAFMVTIDVIVRKLFGVTMAGSDEITGYAFGISIMLSLSYAIIHRSNIRIDAAYQHMPKIVRAILDIFGMVLLVTFIGFVAYRGWFLLLDSYEFGSRAITPLRTPLAIPQTIWFFGMAFAVFTGAVLILIGLGGLLKGDWKLINERMGIPTVNEQIEDET